MSVKKYEVLEKEGVDGLTLGARIIKPGGIFEESAWPYGSEALEKTVKDGRCKLISSSKKEEKKYKGDDK